jgi:hypothetical protein
MARKTHPARTSLFRNPRVDSGRRGALRPLAGTLHESHFTAAVLALPGEFEVDPRFIRVRDFPGIWS